ncbi:MAG: general stress protein [Halieaceae bacterium]|uniref:DUF1269 domain-containing protein n=1 Tax=Haliea alexandrii TaxID=2448162 RepID=UPI000F0B68D5|nr:DUF1269 domain-containing protein [Haliea alexandrii]MCR9186095.1 general stress protein [Halieaceae bacterium]
MERLCFLSPDLNHARQVVNDLKVAGVTDKHIYVLAKHDVDVEGLPDAGPDFDDFMPAYKRGLELGGTAGLLVGLAALAFPPSGIVVGGGLVLLVGLWGAGVGGVLTGIVGGSFSNSKLQSFEAAIDEGKLLIMADVPKNDVERFERIIKKLDPEVEVEGIEPAAPLIP